MREREGASDDLRWFNSIDTSIRSENDLAVDTGVNIAAARIKAKITQQELAKRIGTHQSSIARAERGDTLPTLRYLFRVASALETKIIAPTFENVCHEMTTQWHLVSAESLCKDCGKTSDHIVDLIDNSSINNSTLSNAGVYVGQQNTGVATYVTI